MLSLEHIPCKFSVNGPYFHELNLRNNEIFLSVSERYPADGEKLLEKDLGLDIGVHGGRLGVS